MTNTIRINGVDVPIDELDGLEGPKLTQAYRRHRVNNGVPTTYGNGHIPSHGSGSHFVGTPRLRKHRGDSVGGVRMK